MFAQSRAVTRPPFSLVVALLVIGLTITAPARALAGFIITVTQVGANIRFDYSGSFTGVVAGSSLDTEPYQYGYARRVFYAQDNIGGENSMRGGNHRFEGSYSGGPADFFPGAPDSIFENLISGTSANVTAGSKTVVFNGANGRFVTSSNFTSGSYSASGSFTFLNRTIVGSLGLPLESSNTWNWTQSGQSFVTGNTLTIVTVPEPGTNMLLATGAIACGLGIRRRTMKARA